MNTSSDRLPTILGIVGILAIVAVLFVSQGGACTNDKGARHALESSGYTDVDLTGWAGAWACSRDDVTATKFEATNPRGERVHGVVCCGIAKDCTVRF